MLRLPKGACLLLYLFLLINKWVLYLGEFFAFFPEYSEVHRLDNDAACWWLLGPAFQ